MKIEDLTRSSDTKDKMLKFVLDAVNSGILILDSEGRILFSNSKALSLLLPSKPLIGQHFITLFPMEDREILARNIIKLAERQGEFEGEVMLKRGEGRGFLALLTISFWNQESEKAFIVTINDISRLKGVERMLKRSERMVYLGRMLDDISHQIRNPVLAIGGFSRRLLKTKLERPEYVKVIMAEAHRLELLLDVLTQFIQLPKPRFSFHQAGELAEFIKDIAVDVATQFNAHLELEEKTPAKASVITDMELLRSAVEPVIINACEAYLDLDETPALYLELRCPERENMALEVSVKDQGCGIRPPLIDRIFHPFFTTKTGHLGMGLTFTKRIMEELEGDVFIESTLGKGTSTVLQLPGDRRRPIRTTPL